MDHLSKLEDPLSKKQENFCETAGILGVLIAITCFIQYAIVMIPHWINYIILLIYLFSLVGFILLARKSARAMMFIIISTILIFLLEIFMVLMLVFSLVLLVLLFYSLVMLILLKAMGIQKQLKIKAAEDELEKEKWDNIYQ